MTGLLPWDGALIGKTLLHYQVQSKLGEGGMGEVYRASDGRLGRDVAIKVLPPEFANDAERLARFQREARTLASLHHSNVASVFGYEEAEGTRFLVLELVEGEDLSQRLARGRLELDEAVGIARQIAQGLAVAHDSGIIHRDLKPANIKLTPEGQAKVLDFGLARAGADQTPEELEHSPTITAAMTHAGVILGTAAYMSPEQAKGKAVDRHADIWAFGCVFFEMLTGRQAFDGETVTDVLAAIVRGEPEWDALPAALPGPVERLLRRCLTREIPDRLHHLGDAELWLSEPVVDPTTRAAAPRRRPWAWIGLSGLLAAAALFLWFRGPASGPQTTVQVTGWDLMTDLPGQQVHPNLSTDGRQLLYTSLDGGDEDIFLLRVGGENALNLTADAPGRDYHAAFSPDGEQIAFASDRDGGGIFVMGATGENPRRVSREGYEPAWSPDGTQLVYTTERVFDPYARQGVANLHIIDLATAQVRKLDDIDAAGAHWSPDGSRIAFWTHLESVQGQRDLWTIAVDGSEAPVPVMIDGAADWDPVWSTDGRWLYFLSDRGGNPDVWRIRVDQVSGQPQGDPRPVTTGTARFRELFGVTGGLAVTEWREPGMIQRFAFDPAAERFVGSPQTLHSSAHILYQLTVSHDGQWLCFGTSFPTERLHLMSVDGKVRRKLIDDEHRNRGASLSPDGKWVVFYSNRDGNYATWAIRPDGTGLKKVAGDEVELNEPSWSHDGELFASATNPEMMVRVPLPEGGLDAVLTPVEPEVLPGSEGIGGSSWTDDGSRLGGYRRPGGGPAVFDIQTGTVITPPAGTAATIQVLNPDWIDRDRLLFWDLTGSTAWVWDLRTDELRAVPDAPGPAGYQFADDGHTVYVQRTNPEADIWLLNLEK